MELKPFNTMRYGSHKCTSHVFAIIFPQCLAYSKCQVNVYWFSCLSPLCRPILLPTFFLIFITSVYRLLLCRVLGFKNELNTTTAIGCFIVLENYCKNIDLLTDRYFPHTFIFIWSRTGARLRGLKGRQSKWRNGLELKVQVLAGRGGWLGTGKRSRKQFFQALIFTSPPQPTSIYPSLSWLIINFHENVELPYFFNALEHKAGYI